MQAGKIYNLGTLPAVSFGPAISYTAPAKLAYDATSGSFPYAVANPVSGQSVTATLESGVDWISNIVVGADAVTFTCSKNNAADAQERSAVITLHYTGAADVPVTVTQGVSGSVEEDYVWDFSMADWQAELAAKGAKNDDITDWVSTVEGLTWTSTAKSKWNTATINEVEYTYIQAGGKGTATDRVFTFTVQPAGTVTVLASNTGGSAATDDRRPAVIDATGAVQLGATPAPASNAPQEYAFEVEPGQVSIYPDTNGLRFYKIEFHSK